VADVLGLILGTGLLTAVVVDHLKALGGMRLKFQRNAVERWIETRAARVSEAAIGVMVEWRRASRETSREDSRSVGVEAIRQLDELLGTRAISKGDEHRVAPVFAMPTELLCGQLAGVAELSVAAPDVYSEMFLVLCASGRALHCDNLKEYLEKHRAIMEGKSRNLESPDWAVYGERRAQFMSHAKRALDDLQFVLSRDWRIRLMVTSLAVGLGMAFAFCWLAQPLGPLFSQRGGADPISIVATAMAAVFVGFGGSLMAPVMHDLARAIRGWGR
jgi:hypothetical protein